MDRFRDRFLNPPPGHRRKHSSDPPAPRFGDASPDSSELRPFALHPVAGPNKQTFGREAQFRTGWVDEFANDPSAAARIMIDNWLLFGLEELNGGHPVFLDCTRDTLLSGFLTLLPPRWAILKVLGSVEADLDVLLACRSLKEAGYRIALDDFESPDSMHEFVELADFIKVDFRHRVRRQRACMLRRLSLTRATLIAEKIESEEDFQEAREEGFGLFQGYFFGERISFVKKRDSLDPIHCARILEALYQSDQRVQELAELIELESGIQCRLLRRANWVTPPDVVINSTREALDVVETGDVRRLVTLAMTSASVPAESRSPLPRPFLPRNFAGAGVHSTDMRAWSRWW